MTNKDIEWRKKKLEQVREQIESGQLNALRELLPDRVITQICEECKYYFRIRLLTPLVLVFHMIGAGISREGSFQSAWHLSGQAGRSGVLAKGRKRLPLKVWKGIDEWLVKSLEDGVDTENRWLGHRMIGTDGTCVSMSDEPELAHYFGRSDGKHGKSRFPVARALVAFNLKSLINVGHEAGNYKTDETELLRRLLPRLEFGDVLVGDRHFAGANLYAEYKKAGMEFITRVHQNLKVEKLKLVKELGEGDRIVEMKIHPSCRKKNPSLPEIIEVRVIRTRAKIRGQREEFWIATSLLDSSRYSAQELQGWLKKRWKVEGLIKELKLWLGADVLRSKTVEGIFKEMCARVIALNLIHGLILKSATKHHKKPDRLSVAATLRLATAQSLKMSTAPAWQLPILFEELLDRIAHSIVPYRPDRIEPRMTKRKPKDYPTLKISRTEWRLLNDIAA